MNEFGTSPIAWNMTQGTPKKISGHTPSPRGGLNCVFSNLKYSQITFFDWMKNSKKISAALLDRIKKLCEFQEFELKLSQIIK